MGKGCEFGVGRGSNQLGIHVVISDFLVQERGASDLVRVNRNKFWEKSWRKALRGSGVVAS